MQAFYKVGLPQMARTDVDADGDVQSGLLPAFDLLQSGVDHPLAQRNGKGMVLNHRQEVRRKQQAPLRMQPPNQGLNTDWQFSRDGQTESPRP